MTLAQQTRLQDICHQLEHAHNYASERVRKARACFLEIEKDHALSLIREAIVKSDGKKAFEIIGAWKDKGIHGVLMWLNPHHKCECGINTCERCGSQLNSAPLCHCD